MMTEDIIKMARECGFDVYETLEEIDGSFDAVERFFHLAAEYEREACAKVCEVRANEEIGMAYEGIALDCAVAIRARGNT